MNRLSFPKKIHYFKKISSTNDYAYQLAEKGAEEGEIVIANEQTKGRGRGKRKWFSPPNTNLYLSFILRPSFSPNQALELSLIGAQAILKTIKRLASIKAQIKLPNDVLIQNKKVAGILCQMKSSKERIKFIILGLGINLNQKEFPPYLPQAISLYQIMKKNVSKQKFTEILIKVFFKLYKKLINGTRSPRAGGTWSR